MGRDQKWYRKQRTQRTYMYNPWTLTKGGDAGGLGGRVGPFEPRETLSRFLKRDLTGKKGLARSILSHERQGPTSKITLSSKVLI